VITVAKMAFPVFTYTCPSALPFTGLQRFSFIFSLAALKAM